MPIKTSKGRINTRIPARTETGDHVQKLQPHPSGHRKRLVAMLIIAGWLVMSPIAIQRGLPVINLFGLLAITATAAVIWPINGIKAASWVFVLHAVNFVAEPIANIATGYKHNPFVNLQGFLIVTTLVVLNAIGVGLLSQLRLQASLRKRMTAASRKAGIHNAADRGSNHGTDKDDPDFILQLERLIKLHGAGEISDEEFIKAKQKILNYPDLQ
jgi:hypothetical protein